MIRDGLIFGRSPNLVLGAFTAVFNVVVLVAKSMGVSLTPELVAGINLAAGAIIAVVANNSDIQMAAGTAAASRMSPPPSQPR
jgi:hypothetical protein